MSTGKINLFGRDNYDIFLFENKKTGKQIKVKGYYYWPSDTFTLFYLGRRYVSTDFPYLSNKWIYKEKVGE